MSPEQASGETVDGRTDLYSLGATIYHILADRPPFEGGTNQEIMLKHLTDTPEPLSSIQSQLPKAVVRRRREAHGQEAGRSLRHAAEARDALEAAGKSKVRPLPPALRGKKLPTARPSSVTAPAPAPAGKGCGSQRPASSSPCSPQRSWPFSISPAEKRKARLQA